MVSNWCLECIKRYVIVIYRYYVNTTHTIDYNEILFKQWMSTIQPVVMKRAITSHLKSLNTKKPTTNAFLFWKQNYLSAHTSMVCFHVFCKEKLSCIWYIVSVIFKKNTYYKLYVIILLATCEQQRHNFLKEKIVHMNFIDIQLNCYFNANSKMPES